MAIKRRELPAEMKMSNWNSLLEARIGVHRYRASTIGSSVCRNCLFFQSRRRAIFFAIQEVRKFFFFAIVGRVFL